MRYIMSLFVPHRLPLVNVWGGKGNPTELHKKFLYSQIVNVWCALWKVRIFYCTLCFWRWAWTDGDGEFRAICGYASGLFLFLSWRKMNGIFYMPGFKMLEPLSIPREFQWMSSAKHSQDAWYLGMAAFCAHPAHLILAPAASFYGVPKV